MPDPRPLTSRARLVLLLVLFVAGFMRFSQPGVILLDNTLNPVAGAESGVWPLIVAALNTTAAGLLWWIGWQQFNFTVALVAGLTFALSPWALLLSHIGPLAGLLLPLLVLSGTLAFAESSIWRVTGIAGFVGVLLLAAFTLGVTPLNTTLLPQNAAHIIAGTGAEMVIAPASTGPLLANVPRPDAIWLLFLGSAVAVGLVALWFNANRRAALLIYGAVGLPLFGAVLAPALVLATLPGIALVIGAAAAWLIHLLPGGQITRLIVLAAWGALMLSQALWWRGALRFIELNAPLG